MTLQEIHNLIRKGSTLPHIDVWRGIFLRLNIYVRGIKPNYCITPDDIYRIGSRREMEVLEKYTPIFDTEIFSRYPHDTPAQLNFRKSIAHIDDMKSLVDRFFQQSKSILFQGGNFEVRTEDPQLLRWLAEVRIDGFTFREWVKHVLYTSMINDPNAFAVVYEAHTEPFALNSPYDPRVRIVGSEEMAYYDGKALAYGPYVIDAVSQAIFTDKSELVVMVPHRMGEIPAVQLGGQYSGNHIWHSFIQSFIGIANNYVQEKSDAVIAKKTLAPRLQIILPACIDCGGTGKEDTDLGQVRCKTCKGSGKISVNLGDVVPLSEDRAIMDDGKLADLDRFKYTTPDPEYINLLTKDADTEYTRAEKALFIYRKETAASESANNLDKQFEEKKIFFQAIADRLHYVIGQIIGYVSMYQNYNLGKPKAAAFQVVKPIDFDLTSAADALMQYSEERKENLPVALTNSTELQYARKVFGEGSLPLRQLEFLQLYDPLYGKSADAAASQGVDPFDTVTHIYLAGLLTQYVAEVTAESFLRQPHSVTWAALEPRVRAKFDALPTML